MNQKRITYLRTIGASAGLCALLLLPGSCSVEDMGANSDSAGLVPTVIAASIGRQVTSRASDPATGFDGVIKTDFIVGDEINMTYNNSLYGIDKVQATIATRTEQQTWDMGLKDIFLDKTLTEGQVLTAVYGNREPKDGVYQDMLTACYRAGGTNTDSGVILLENTVDDKGKPVKQMTIRFKHVMALIDITVKNAADKPMALAEVRAVMNKIVTPAEGVPNSSKESLACNHSSDVGWNRGQLIVPVAYTEEGVGSYTYTLTEFWVTLANNTQLKAVIADDAGLELNAALSGHRIPIEITLTAYGKAEISIGKSIADWQEESITIVPPAGYDVAIGTPAQLALFRDRVNLRGNEFMNGKEGRKWKEARVIQLADIDLSEIESWEPIGYSSENGFAGWYNGNGYTITGMRIERLKLATPTIINKNGCYYAGLFGVVLKDAVMMGIQLQGVMIKYTCERLVGECRDLAQDFYFGALMGYAHPDVVVTLCSANGSIVAVNKSRSSASSGNPPNNSYIGGLIGYSEASINRCWSLCNVAATGQDLYVGGLIGYSSKSVTSCMAGGAIDTYGLTTEVGGNLYATRCRSLLNVGGLVGSNSALVGCSYATGSVAATIVNGRNSRLNDEVPTSIRVGGFVGFNTTETSVCSDNYCTGLVNVYSEEKSSHQYYSYSCGGFVGVSTSKIMRCFAASIEVISPPEFFGLFAGYLPKKGTGAFYNNLSAEDKKKYNVVRDVSSKMPEIFEGIYTAPNRKDPLDYVSGEEFTYTTPAAIWSSTPDNGTRYTFNPTLRTLNCKKSWSTAPLPDVNYTYNGE